MQGKVPLALVCTPLLSPEGPRLCSGPRGPLSGLCVCVPASVTFFPTARHSSGPSTGSGRTGVRLYSLPRHGLQGRPPPQERSARPDPRSAGASGNWGRCRRGQEPPGPPRPPTRPREKQQGGPAGSQSRGSAASLGLQGAVGRAPRGSAAV